MERRNKVKIKFAANAAEAARIRDAARDAGVLAMEPQVLVLDLRNEKKMTQTELAEVLGVSTQAVSKWENGGGFPDVQTIPDIARALDTTTDYLFNRVRRQQKVFVFNVLEGDGLPSRGPNYRRKYKP